MSEADDFPVEAEPTKAKAPRPKPTEATRRKLSEAGSRGAANRATKQTLDQIRTSIAEGVGKGGAVILPFAPLPGGYCVATADDLAGVVVRLAERNPRLLASLAQASVAADYIALGTWGAGFVVAVMAQTGRMDPRSPIAANLGVTAVYDDLIASGAFVADDGGYEDASPGSDDRPVPVPDLLGGGPDVAPADLATG